MGIRGCEEYGTGWERYDPDCQDCPDAHSCRERMLRRGRLSAEKRRTKSSSNAPAGSNRASYSYHTNPNYLLPAEGESAAARIGKNMLAGGLSAAGGEIFVFFQEWRWPFCAPALKEPKPKEPEPPPKSKKSWKEKRKSRTKPKPAKIKIDGFDDLDDDDEIDIDLDDL